METGIGETLREAREAQGRTHEDAAHALRLRAEQVRALEEERFGSFGGDVYARGFLKSYAVELGLDPQPLLDTYRREVSGADPIASAPLAAPGSGGMPGGRRGGGGGGAPAWVAWVVAAVVILAGLALVGQFAGGRAPEQASPEPTPAPVAPAEDAEDEDDEAEGEPEPEPEPEPEDEADTAEVELFLALEADSWMRVTVDDTVVFEQVATQGETLQFSGEESVTVRYGNAGGVRVEHNGEDLGVPGSSGSVVEVEYTPDGQSGD